jgi:ribosomal protein S28E/S33
VQQRPIDAPVRESDLIQVDEAKRNRDLKEYW